jgi:hypothetical protein
MYKDKLNTPNIEQRVINWRHALLCGMSYIDIAIYLKYRSQFKNIGAIYA